MWLIIANVAMAILATVSAYILWRVYLMAKNKGILFLLLAVVFMVVVRIGYCINPATRDWQLGLVFWILFPIGLFLLRKDLARYIK